ncbi:DUF134 domain-containing protein [Christensenellaceae bacterium OttesenSCG-928-K19]|nr:DUF134 domain-containing protein [Christensenellaceae bacterium OttesenSCG-928-K19]
MPRPQRSRKICQLPGSAEFMPKEKKAGQIIVMTVDEYEAIRLIDKEGFTQEQCAEQMGVSRTTVQAIYASARRKLADCIVSGLHLSIKGGEVQVCEHRGHSCGNGCCHGQRCNNVRGEEKHD